MEIPYRGVTADALDVYGKVKNYTGGETRFFTGLQLKGGEYQAAKVKEGDTTYQSSWFDGRNEVILCTVKMDDAAIRNLSRNGSIQFCSGCKQIDQAFFTKIQRQKAHQSYEIPEYRVVPFPALFIIL